MTSIGKAAAEDAAWAKLQRSAVWWVGEHANAAAMEYAGDNEAVKATAGITAAMQKTASPGEIIAMQVCHGLPRRTLLAAPCSDALCCVVLICSSCVASTWRLHLYWPACCGSQVPSCTKIMLDWHWCT